ncbi:MAG: helix-turn-helix domain-containing protein [Paludibacter sp.]|nr:helix-turn-helix domain-containing protein [Paludibacter sp.]
MNTLVWIGFCQSLFAAILLFSKRNRSASDTILSIWLVLLSIDFISCALNYEIFKRPMLTSSFLLFNPALYLYIKSLTNPRFRVKWLQLLHLLPFLFFETYMYIIKQSFSLTTFFLPDHNFIFRLFVGSATIISWCIYNPLSLVLVHKHRMNLRNEMSTIERNENLGWVLAVGIFYVVYCILALLITVVAFYAKLNPATPHIYNYIALLILIYCTSFYGLRQKAVSQLMHLNEPQDVPYKNSNLSIETKESIKKKIINYFENEKAYLNPELNMTIVSESLKIPKYQITEVLNIEIGKSFYQFVNQYRVEAVKAMLSDSNNKYSIEAIGYDCGFSSKSSFYTVFKSMTGETPVSFRNSISPRE